MTITRLHPSVNFNGDCSKAIALYQRQGMEIRRRLHVTVLQRQD